MNLRLSPKNTQLHSFIEAAVPATLINVGTLEVIACIAWHSDLSERQILVCLRVVCVCYVRVHVCGFLESSAIHEK